MTQPRPLLAGALCVLAIGSGWVAVRPEPAPAAVAVAARPVWSPERLPAVLAEAQGTVELERAVDELLGSVSASCLVVHEGDRPVLARRPELALVPASTQKALVAAAALSRLGPDFRFETRLVAAEGPRDGVVGPLWLVGAGDPFLVTPEYLTHLADRPRFGDRRPTRLTDLVDDLARAGVRRVTGGITGDDSRHDRVRFLPTWPARYRAQNQAGPLSALMVNSGFAAFEPSRVPADDPAVHAAAELTRLAEERGISVAGAPGRGTPPAGARTVARIRSVPLREIVAAVVAESDNTAAELLVREIGRQAGGDGSTPAGTEAVVAELARLGLPTAGLRLDDGSGLAEGNRSSCTLLERVVRADAGIRAGLAVAGRSGTLLRRFAGTPLEGRVRGKTGSIRGVTALTGVIEGRRQLTFALVANGDFTPAAGRLLEDRVVALLANYPAPQPDL